MCGRPATIAIALLLLAPLQLMAQTGGQGRGAGQQGPGGPLMTARTLLEHGSVEHLVEKAADLQLTAEQVQTLQQIGAAWSEETKSSRTRIQAVMPAPGRPAGGGGGDRQAMMMQVQELMPVMQKLVDDDARALEEAMKLLSETQQTTAHRLLEERRESMRPRRGG
jgi:hypothetical protein